MRKGSWKVTYLALLCAVILALSGCSLLPVEEGVLAPPLLEPARERFNTFEVKLDSIAYEVKATGFFQAVEAEYHQFEGATGRVESFNVKAGDSVKKGDLLVQLEIEDLDLQVLKQELDLEKAKVGYLQALQGGEEQDINLRKLEFEVAQLSFNKTSERLASRQLYAKMDGVVIFAEKLEPNDMVYDQRVLVSVADLSKLRLHYEVSNPMVIADVQIGMKAEVKHRGASYVGTVVQTPASAPSTTDQALAMKYSRSLYIELDEPPKDVGSGDSADFVITLEERHHTIVIPSMGVRSYMGRNYVHIMDGESRREIDVELGLETPTRVEILKGLEVGQQVIMQ